MTHVFLSWGISDDDVYIWLATIALIFVVLGIDFLYSFIVRTVRRLWHCFWFPDTSA